MARNEPYAGTHGASDFLALSEGEIAVLRLRQLGHTVQEPLLAALSRLNSEQRRPKALVIDLSRCSLGDPDVATTLVNALAPGRLALQVAIRDKQDRIARRNYAGDADWGLRGLAGIPVFVIVSEDTGAMGEAVALALRAHRGATLVGRAKVGIGRLAYWYALPWDMWFGFTVADVFAADGQPIAGRAVLPDVCPSSRGMQALRDRTLETYEQTCSAAHAKAAQPSHSGLSMRRQPSRGDVSAYQVSRTATRHLPNCAVRELRRIGRARPWLLGGSGPMSGATRQDCAGWAAPRNPASYHRCEFGGGHHADPGRDAASEPDGLARYCPLRTPAPDCFWALAMDRPTRHANCEVRQRGRAGSPEARAARARPRSGGFERGQEFGGPRRRHAPAQFTESSSPSPAG